MYGFNFFLMEVIPFKGSLNFYAKLNENYIYFSHNLYKIIC